MNGDPAAVIRAAFPKWKTDPYQKHAADALLRMLFAGENAERELAAVEKLIAHFIQEPPFSIGWAAPANRAEVCARKLEVLAAEIRKGVSRFRELAPYIDQFSEPAEALTA